MLAGSVDHGDSLGTCGNFWGVDGPVDGLAADPRYLDVWVPPGVSRSLQVEHARHAFAYIFDGEGWFAEASEPRPVRTEGVIDAGRAVPSGDAAGNRSLVLFDAGDEVRVRASEQGLRFLLVSGRPIEEPVAWYGPVVMNTQEELDRAFRELKEGTFLGHSDGG